MNCSPEKIVSITNIGARRLAELEQRGWLVNGYALIHGGDRALIDRFGAVYYLPTDADMQDLLEKLHALRTNNSVLMVTLAETTTCMIEAKRRSVRAMWFCLTAGLLNLAAAAWWLWR